MELYIKISLELPDGTTVLLVPEQWEQTTFSFVMPAISVVNETVTVGLLITAINMHDNSSILNKSLILKNALPYSYESSLFSPSIDLTDLKDLALLSSQMQLILKSPAHLLVENTVWSRNSDWSNHGTWENDGLMCSCDDGYSGVDWSIHYQIFSSLSSIVDSAVDYLSSTLVTESYTKRSDIQMNFEILTGLLVRPDLYSFQRLHSLASILEGISGMKDTVLLALPNEFEEAFIKFASHYYVCAMHEMKTSMIYYNETEFTESSTIYPSYYGKTMEIKSESEAVWVSVERYLIKASRKLSIDSTIFEYASNIGSFKIEYMLASSLNGNTYSINSVNDYKITLPTNLFDGSTLTDLSFPIRVLTASWSLSPVILSNEDTYKTISDTISLHIIDSAGDTIQITNKSISITLPLLYKSYTSTTSLECKAWDLDESENKFVDSDCSVSSTDSAPSSFLNCGVCSPSSTFTIHTAHLSSFTIVEPTNRTVIGAGYDGIDHGRDPPLTTTPIYKSLFTIIIIILLSIYTTGSFILIKYNKVEF